MASCNPLRLGTRQSALAQWQAQWVATRLRELNEQVEIIFITTRGDTEQGPIGTDSGVGLFTKAIQRALLQDEIDLAVHSLKDLPTEPFEGLTLTAVPRRASVRDALISRRGVTLDQLAAGAIVGTGSLRRQAQLLHRRPDLDVKHIRGNVDTRLRKLKEGQFEAIILAEAGLTRLGLESNITEVLSPSVMLPAVGQGALGIETRDDDARVIDRVRRLDDPPSHAAIGAERALLAHLRGGCLAPVGAWGRTTENGSLAVDAVVLSPDGRQRLAGAVSGPIDHAQSMGRQLADELVEQGADQLIAASRNPTG